MKFGVQLWQAFLFHQYSYPGGPPPAVRHFILSTQALLVFWKVMAFKGDQ